MIVVALSAGARAALNVSYLSPAGAPAVLLACGVLGCAAVFLFSRSGSRLAGGVGLAVLSFPIGWSLMLALPSVSAEASRLYATVMRPVLELPPLLALGTMLLPEMLLACFFLIGTLCARRTVHRTSHLDSSTDTSG
ncbi:hypothetical protein B7R22_14295 [Subtercola boreus]|uniref:Uncharacterized protein n=2 Tax=Subtercola boreus TaxID=120213 RepID=A0A3E0VT23_9MICO|nr:hypothetical protein B7R22_14295 [Subtercola boreus]